MVAVAGVWSCKLLMDGLVGALQVRLPFSKDGLKIAMLNAERYAERNVQRHVQAGKATVPPTWKKDIESVRQERTEVDFDRLIQMVDAMSEEEFAKADVGQLVERYSR